VRLLRLPLQSQCGLIDIAPGRVDPAEKESMIRLSLRTGARTELVDLTGRLQDVVRQNGCGTACFTSSSPTPPPA